MPVTVTDRLHPPTPNLYGLDTWRTLPAAQQPPWPDEVVLREVALTLAGQPPLVVASEVDQLRERLAAVARGEAFLLQGGDCAETFATSSQADIAGKVRVLLQMAVVLTYGASMPVVKLGRIAGQYAKPRSSDIDATGRPSYRGDMVNELDRRPHARPAAHPAGLLHGRLHAEPAAGLRRRRAGLARPGARLEHRVRPHAPTPARATSSWPARSTARCGSCAPAACTTRRSRASSCTPAHEALILEYERALTRVEDGRAYDLSGHFVWVGERTRQMDGAHLDFVSRIANPIGVKLGPTTTPEFAAELVERLDPDDTPGRLTLISRMSQRAGARRAAGDRREGARRPGTSSCGSATRCTATPRRRADGVKTRHLDRIIDEVDGFFDVHAELGTHPGGLHVELTGDDVTECIGGTAELTAADLGRRYETACDPRLNIEQSLELAFRVAERLVAATGGRAQA